MKINGFKSKLLFGLVLALSLLGSKVAFADDWRRWHEPRHHHSYRAPVYPYPAPYVSEVLVAPTVVQPAPVVVQPPVVPVPVAPSAPVIQQQNLPPVWYYCEASKTYYPYVSKCAGEWKQVPAVPPGK